MNKKFLTAASLLALVIILGKQTANAYLAPAQPGMPETYVIDDIPATKTTRGCTAASPCKFLGGFSDDVRGICVSAAAGKIGTAKFTAAGANVRFQTEAGKYNCYLKFLPAVNENENNGKIYCATGLTARFFEPDNNYDLAFNSLGRVALNNLATNSFVTIAPTATKCFVYFEGSNLGSKLGHFGKEELLSNTPINSTLSDAVFFEDNTTQPRVGGKPQGDTPTIAVTKAVKYLQTGVK